MTREKWKEFTSGIKNHLIKDITEIKMFHDMHLLSIGIERINFNIFHKPIPEKPIEIGVLRTLVGRRIIDVGYTKHKVIGFWNNIGDLITTNIDIIDIQIVKYIYE